MDEVEEKEEVAGSPDTQPTVEERVNAILRDAKESKDGKLKFDEGTTEEVKIAARYAQRYRNTQSALTKAREETSALNATNKELLQQLQKSSVGLTKEQETELEELKFENPDAYYEKRKRLEDGARKELEKQLSDMVSANAKKSKLVARQAELQDFLKDNEGFKIDDDVIEMELPPRISKKIKDPEHDLTEALKEARDYLMAGKRVQNTSVEPEPNLSDTDGDSKRSELAEKQTEEKSYEETVF